jgi:hypothetical protein
MSTEATHREIGVALISVGWMGRLHTRAYKAVAEHFPELGLRARLVIAADTVEAGAREAAGVLGYQSWTLDYNDVLTHPDVDVVSICAPNFLHKAMALAAAKAGKPFWIESSSWSPWSAASSLPRRRPTGGPPPASPTPLRNPRPTAHGTRSARSAEPRHSVRDSEEVAGDS